ncbi:MAG: substrate-binding domain-containing protein [Porticoccaceae bacterium]|jgi:phosphate transport system substrate-binding protein
MAAIIGGTQVHAARDYISVVGSSTVYPFSTVVAERFGRATGNATPKVESVGTGGGLKMFCAGVGTNFADIANASRRIKGSEFKDCQSNGVKDIIEVLIGYDGIVVANSLKTKPYDLSRKDIFLALAKEVPSPDGSETLVPNPYKTWKDINPALPATKIEVIGPPPTSGTRDAFAELALESGCATFGFIKALKDSDEKKFKSVCHTLREDGHYVEAGENDNLIIQKLDANPDALGVFGFSFLDQNSDKVRGSAIEGVEPTFEAIGDKSYSVSRPLYFYVKKAHIGVVPGIEEFLAEFTSEKAWGADGYLAEKGLIPLNDELRKEVGAAVRGNETLTGEGL